MEKSDIAQIKLGSVAFTSKWWKEKRAIITNGSGVAKALDLWQKHCPKDPELISDQKAVVEAAKVCGMATAAFTKAKKKAGKLAKDTATACDVYLKIIADYESKLGKGVTEGYEDADTWKQIQGMLPKISKKVFDLMDEMDSKTDDMAKLRQTLKLIKEKADIRNKMPLHGGRDDLIRAMTAIGKDVATIDKFVNGEAAGYGNICAPLLNLADKLTTRAHVKEMQSFRNAVREVGQREGKLRSDFTSFMLVYTETNDTVNKVTKSAQQVANQFETYSTVFWDNPTGNPKDLMQTFGEVEKRCDTVLNKAGQNPDERAKRDMAVEAKSIDDELLQIDATITNLSNTLKNSLDLVRKYPGDKKMATEVKNMAASIKVLEQMRTKVDGKVKRMQQIVTAMA